jgi:hypothetical protein
MKNWRVVLIFSGSRRTDSGGIAQLVERLVRNEYSPIALTFAHALLSALS